MVICFRIEVTSHWIFTLACNFVVAKTYFRKSDYPLITFKRGNLSQTYFILTGRLDRTLCKDRKVFTGEAFTSQHKLLMQSVKAE